MISKNSYWKLSKMNMKRRVPYLVVSFLICFIFMTIISYFEIRSYARYIDRYDITHVLNDVARNLATGNYLQDFVVIALAVLMALTGNAWNNSQKKNDFYKSLPVKERTRFIYIHANSLSIFVISFGLNLILANLIVACNGLYVPEFVVITLYSFGIHTLEFMAVYMVAVIAQYLTGNMILAVCLTGILGIAETAIRVLVDSYKETFYKTYLMFILDYSRHLYQNWTSPVAGALRAHQSISEKSMDFYLLNNYGEIAPGVIQLLLQIVIYTAIAYFIYNRRPAQNGDKNLVFSVTKPFIKCLIMIPVIGAFVLMVINETEEIIVPGLAALIVALVILHIVLQFVIEGDFAAVKRGFGSTTAAGVLVACALAVFFIAGAKFDTYKPDVADVQSVCISTGNEYAYNFYDNNATHSILRSNEYFINDVKLTDSTFIKEVVAIISDDIDSGRYYFDEWAKDGEGAYLDIAFNMNNGKRVKRRYVLPIEHYNKIVYDMYDLDEYRHYSNELEYANNKYYLENAQKLDIVYYNYGFSSYDICAVENRDLQKKLLEALEIDYNLRSADVYRYSVPIGNVEIRAMCGGKLDVDFNIPLYVGDVNSIEVFKEMGYEPHGINLEDVTEIQITRYDIASEYEKDDVRLNRGDEMFDVVLENFVMLEGCYGHVMTAQYSDYDITIYNKDRDAIRGVINSSFDSKVIEALFE